MENSLPTKERPGHPSFWEAFAYWLKLGFISFGGPAGQIAIMHQELVERRRWISEKRFLHALNYCMVLPGPEAQQLAIYIGWLLHGLRGGIAAGTLFVLPSLFILAALTYIYLTFGQIPWVNNIFNGIKPAVVAIVIFAAWRIGSRALTNNLLRGLAVLAFVAIFALKIPFPYIVLTAALLGFFGGRIAPEKFKLGGGHHAKKHSFGPALIDDDTAPPPHANYSFQRTASLVATFVLLWLAVIATTAPGVLRDMSIFFTKAALVTFGGAYAVLPYVYQGGVETYGWLNATQMMDGLALGETTPGPLIMVVAFVGYVGAWSHAVLGPDALSLAGMTGATVATYFTFLPSFLFILVGAPFIEATHGDLKFTAPLTAITAAVVGVVLNLALFFGWHVLWPKAEAASPFSGDFQWFAALVSIAALVALWRYKQNIMLVIGVCAFVGLLHTFAN